MGFFKNNKTQETKPVEQVQLTANAAQRSVLIQKDLSDKKRELEQMDKTMKSLQEQIENKRVLIASYQKNIIDNQKDYDRISSKHRILEDDIHTLEKELTLYNKGTHKDLLNTQELENLNFLQAVETIKKFDEKEKAYLDEIEILKNEISKLKKLTEKESKPDAPKFEVKIETPKPKEGNFLEKIFKRKKSEDKQTIISEAENKHTSEIVKEVVSNVVKTEEPKTTKKAIKKANIKKNDLRRIK